MGAETDLRQRGDSGIIKTPIPRSKGHKAPIASGILH